MKNDGWPTFSFTEMLRPPEGWTTEHAILTTYSADLVVLVTALLALTRCDLEQRRTGSRVELVKAIEALRGRVCILAQAGRVVIPRTPRPILKLLDKFLRTVDADENESSWHPKIAMLRFRSNENAKGRQWRIWIGSRNLTPAMNWEAGLILASRTDRRGQKIRGLARVGAALATRANLDNLSATAVEAELAAMTWDCPPGSEIQSVDLLGPGLVRGLPKPPSDTERVFVVSPFLDAPIVRAVAGWGNTKTRRTIVSTANELQRLYADNNAVFGGFDHVFMQPFPDLPEEGAEMLDEQTTTATEAVETENSPAGLHAKLLFAAKGARRQLWIGSANATQRGWEGRNFEVVAAVTIAKDAANAVEEFVASCERFIPGGKQPAEDVEETALEQARKLLCGHWPLQQHVSESEVEVVAPNPPPLAEPDIKLEVAALGGMWNVWPRAENRIVLSGLRRSQRSDFLQIRVSRGERACAWLQVTPCIPPPDEERDRALVAQYLNARTFLLWVRSLLADEPARAGGGDWDADTSSDANSGINDRTVAEVALIPTVEEILRAWARDASGFIAADKKVKTYLHELERRAKETGNVSDVALLQSFRRTWDTLALELR